MRPAVASLVLWLAAGPGLAAKVKWDPVNPADLAARDSTSSPGADAEILFSRHLLDTSIYDLVTEHYVRAKIYTPKGVEEQGKLDIEGQFGATIEDVVARVVKPDGTTVDLAKGDIHEGTLMKIEGFKVPRTSFAFPNLTPGDIVEFQWRDRQRAQIAVHMYYWLYCQDKVPVREFQFAVANYPVAYQVAWFNGVNAEVKREGRHAGTLVMRNLPAFKEEEDMPPQRDFRAWVMIAFDDPSLKSSEQWEGVTQYLDELYEDFTSPGGPVKQQAARLIAGAAGREEQLRRLYEFCRREIVNFDWADAPEQQAAKRKNEERDTWQSPKETLNKRSGSGTEINLLFAALARAAGFEVKIARNARRSDLLDVRVPKGWNFLTELMVAVKEDGQWVFHEPGRYFVPMGMLKWWDEGANALLPDSKQLIFTLTPVSVAEASAARRTGRFTLDADGTLEGTVEQALTGHLAVNLKSEFWSKAQDEVDRSFRDGIVERLPTAEVSEIKWENLRTLDFPVTVKYQIRVPGYAERAGKRLIVTPGFFEMGRPARFTAETRRFPIFFSFAWSEHDDVEITLPAGLEMESGEPPQDVTDHRASLGATYRMGYRPRQRLLFYRRDFALGASGAISFRSESYAVLKGLFEALHQSDIHSLVLAPAVFDTEEPAGDSAPAPAPAATEARN